MSVHRHLFTGFYLQNLWLFFFKEFLFSLWKPSAWHVDVTPALQEYACSRKKGICNSQTFQAWSSVNKLNNRHLGVLWATLRRNLNQQWLTIYWRVCVKWSEPMGLVTGQDRSGKSRFASGMAEGSLLPFPGCWNLRRKYNKIAFALWNTFRICLPELSFGNTPQKCLKKTFKGLRIYNS